MKPQSQLLNCLLLLALTLSYQFALAQAPTVDWQKTIGGSGDEVGNAVLPLVDGSFISCGYTASSDGDFTSNQGDYDAYIIKHDASGNILWQKTYGGSGFDEFYNVVLTNKGEFMAFGSTTSNDGDVSGNHGGSDLWAVHLNMHGEMLGQNCYGGSGEEYASNIIAVQENNFVFSCGSNSTDGDVSGNHGDFDAWVVKINRKGKIIWQKCFGGSAYDDNWQVLLSNDNKLFIAGPSLSNDGDVAGNHGGINYGDAWVVKMNQAGNLLWSRCYGGSGDEFTSGIALTGYGVIVAGGTTSADGDVIGNHGGYDLWLASITSTTGDLLWQKCYGTADGEAAHGIFNTSDGGFVALGAVGTVMNYPTWNAQATKVDSNSNEIWTKTFGGSEGDLVWWGFETEDSDLLLQGNTNSSDGDITNQHGEGDSWLVKLGDGGERISPQVEIIIELNCYPNPISTSATISFSLSQSERVSIRIFDLQGRLIRTLANEVMTAGTHELTWDTHDKNGNAVSTGIYLLQFSTEENSEVIRLSVMK